MESKTHTIKRILACIMVVVMAVTVIPLSGLANYCYSYTKAVSDNALNDGEISALKDILSSMCDYKVGAEYAQYNDELMSCAYRGITYKKNDISITERALRTLVPDLQYITEGAQYSYSMKYYGNIIKKSNWKIREDNKDPKGRFKNQPYFVISAECIDSIVESIFNVSANHDAYEKYTYYYYNNMFYYQAYVIETAPKSIDILDIKTENNGTYTVKYKLYIAGGDDFKEDVRYMTSNVSKVNNAGKWRINSVKRNKTITDAYKSVLVDCVNSDSNYIEYMIYDIDKDGTTELIVYRGNCEALSEFRFYTYNGKDAIYIGNCGASHRWLYGINKTNGVYLFGGHFGNIYLDKITKINNRLKITSIYTKTDDEQITVPKNSLPSFEIYDWSGVDEKAVSKPLPAFSCTLSATEYTYDGKVKNPIVTVKDSTGKKLVKGTDYTLSASSGRKNVGKYTVKVTFIGKYTGSKTLYFYIRPGTTSKISAASSASSLKLSWEAVPGATGYSVYYYSTSAKSYKKLKDVTSTTYTVSGLKSGTDYKFAVKAYTKVGSTVYQSAGYQSLTTSTKPGTPTLTVTAGTKKATLKWNKQTGATGYVVYMATSANGKYTKIATVKGNSAVSFTKTSLTTGRTYYFKVAAYKTVESSNLYGSYSSVKSAKIK